MHNKYLQEVLKTNKKGSHPCPNISLKTKADQNRRNKLRKSLQVNNEFEY